MCLIVDFHMPEMNGFELHQHLVSTAYKFRRSSSLRMVTPRYKDSAKVTL